MFFYDKAGNIIRITDDCVRDEKFAYTLMDQRTEKISSEGRTQKIVYDKEGNITERQLPQEMSYRYQYDSAGQVYHYDAQGNVTGIVDGNGNKRIYAYDDNNQLKAN